MMGESRCFLCRQGFCRGRRLKVRVFLCDDSYRDEEVCGICFGVVRGRGEVVLKRGGESFLVRELVSQIPQDTPL